MAFSNKIPYEKIEKKSIKKKWSENKQFNSKKIISKSNSSQRKKMSLNEEWYIILRELEAEEIIYQNYIKHGSHLKYGQL